MKKVIIMSISGLTLLSASMPSAVDMVQASNVNVVQEPDSKAFDVRNETVQVDITEKTKTNFELSDKDQKIADAITDFYALDEEGKIKFNATVKDLTDLGISEKDAKLMIEDAEAIQDVPMRLRGFVGLHINLGPKIRAMNAWAAGLYAGGRVGFALKVFATNPHTAGVVAIISGSVVGSVRWAVQNRVRRISVGVHLPRVSLSRTVSLP
ncbi:hypothetical protein [Lactococcus formosensis]|uniref:Uncharacterized protein n=1 Tax=Lactococcus formosensis TaxID=1281486 RepID=A0A9Q8Y0E0_9LACT|nr:hypothetical protein [Lactococcus formosensis]MCO7180207.1 hypothetical protein [Lactococcus formosensis]MDG6111109.1 hypothetical protein [Lactococcus formosensis]MDG6117283.1 hypothetical protein [Lactococcus formosensis]MDG6126159.1 hypothetical protein [Lactococcus formosensis]MDG6132740.1 hypothetical protein [Lactococcus formosensis]